MSPPPTTLAAQCSYPGCDTHDFLPVKCNRCSTSFCKDHIARHLSDCTASVVDDASKVWTERAKCTMEGCQKPTLDSAVGEGEIGKLVCESCGAAFCASHRHPSSHDCGSLRPLESGTEGTEKEDKNARARALLAKAFPNANTSAYGAPSGSTAGAPSASSSQKQATKPKTERQRQVEVMRMRHRAIPGEAVYARKGATLPEVDKRRFVKVIVGAQEKEVWVSKDAIVGRVVDYLVTIMKVPKAERVWLEKEGVELSLSRTVAEQAVDGDTLVMVTGGLGGDI